MKENDNLQQMIWSIVASIPQGKVMSYGQVARLAGYPSHARMVGRVLHKLPKDTKIPWHRVINSQGKLSFPVASESYLIQKFKLEEEGVKFKNDKIIFPLYGYLNS